MMLPPWYVFTTAGEFWWASSSVSNVALFPVSPVKFRADATLHAESKRPIKRTTLIIVLCMCCFSS